MTSYQNYLDEKALHMFMKKLDLKLAQSMHKKLIDENVIDRGHKYPNIIKRKDIHGYQSHGESDHNYRDEIESYNQIVTRNEKYL